ncbi:MAG: AgmX/PglI C-terminal domain-containing protein [Byssovorax sp.]
MLLRRGTMTIAMCSATLLASCTAPASSGRPGASSSSAPAPSVPPSSSSTPPPAPLDLQGPELTLLGLAGGPASGPSSQGRLGSRFVKKVVFVSIGAPEIKGRLLPALATSLVEAKTKDLYTCYRDRLRDAPTVTGEVAYALTVDVHGRVSEALPSGALTDPPLLACLGGVLSGLSFPTAAGPSLHITYPLKLELGTTVRGKSILGITEADMRAAMVDAGCTEVTYRGPAYADGPIVITAKKDAGAVAVALVLPSGHRLSEATIARLAERGAVYHEGDPFVVAAAVEGDPDRAKATALLAAIVHDPR